MISKRKRFIIDTSVLLYDKKSIHSFPGNDIILPLQVIDEIDKFKEKKTRQRKTEKVDLSSVPEKILRINDYVTEARLHNVISKIGIIKREDFSKLMKNFCADVIKDYQKDEEVDEKELNVANQILQKEAIKLVKEYMSKNV